MHTDYPYIFDNRPKLALSAWLKMLGANVLSFVLLTTPVLSSIPLFKPLSNSELYDVSIMAISRQIMPALLFLAINFLGVYWAVGKDWRKLFRPIKVKDIWFILLLILAAFLANYFTGQITDALFGHEVNPNAAINIHHENGWAAFLLARVTDLIQLLGEEFLAIISFLAFTQLANHWNWSRKTALVFGLVLSSILFGVYHISTYDYNVGYAIIGLFLGRMVMTIAFMRTKSIWASFLVHYIYDFIGFYAAFVALAH